MSARRAAGLLAAALVISGCGGQAAPDLFEVRRTGDDRGANVSLVVSDSGTVTCDGGPPRPLSGDRLLTARELSRELTEAATLGLELPPGPDPILSYRVRLEAGTVAFSDTSRDKPPSFNQLAGFVHDVAENVCGVER